MFSEAFCAWKYRYGTGHILFENVAGTPFYNYGTQLICYTGLLCYWFYLRFKPGHTIKYPIEADYETGEKVKVKKYNKGFSKSKKNKSE